MVTYPPRKNRKKQLNTPAPTTTTDYKEKKIYESLTLCGQCGKQTVERIRIEYTVKQRVGDAFIEFKVPDCPIGQCSDHKCNSKWFDWESSEAIDKEFRNVVAEIIRKYK